MLKIMNSAIMLADGTWERETIAAEEVKPFALGHRIESYLGYPSAARIMSDLLGVDVPVNRETTNAEPGDIFLVMRLPYRPPSNEKSGAIHGNKVEDYVFHVVRFVARNLRNVEQSGFEDVGRGLSSMRLEHARLQG